MNPLPGPLDIVRFALGKFISEGTEGPIVQLSSNIENAGNSELSFNAIIFNDQRASTGAEPYSTHSSLVDMVPVKDIRSGRTGSRPAHFSKLNNTAYFTAHTEIEGRELWCSNGTSSRFFQKNHLAILAKPGRPAIWQVARELFYWVQHFWFT